MERDYHCCATCQHFQVLKHPARKTEYKCARLGYMTKPAYRFECWTPKDIVVERMRKKHIRFTK
ncbi:hypothetical protein P4S91_20280 [Aneurinibacillus aneurinilyticus]|nr:hypothetical protein [Aneurinibacillus aneurinilyticus]MED0704549.1 hypothetical protein [Aneurinibacillus aneurinilyticus]MED0725239.1 hypothetical protein [Aneurinibacillus aneurinilyticus]MED0734465.1 hypothetical protein [Aneurinibacillus aneurinilyticus]MED0742505.1 hypothetical protein [Aneurinibacillus aneurinilyticus]